MNEVGEEFHPEPGMIQGDELTIMGGPQPEDFRVAALTVAVRLVSPNTPYRTVIDLADKFVHYIETGEVE